jgi:hypothetical protein
MNLTKEGILSSIKDTTFEQKLDVLIDYGNDELDELVISIIKSEVDELLRRIKELEAENRWIPVEEAISSIIIRYGTTEGIKVVAKDEIGCFHIVSLHLDEWFNEEMMLVDVAYIFILPREEG